VNANNRECEIRDLAKSCGRKYGRAEIYAWPNLYHLYIRDFTTFTACCRTSTPLTKSVEIYDELFSQSRETIRKFYHRTLSLSIVFSRYVSYIEITSYNRKVCIHGTRQKRENNFRSFSVFFSPRKKMFPLKRCFFFLRKVLFDSLHNTITWFDVYIYRKIILMDRCEKFY